MPPVHCPATSPPPENTVYFHVELLKLSTLLKVNLYSPYGFVKDWVSIILTGLSTESIIYPFSGPETITVPSIPVSLFCAQDPKITFTFQPEDEDGEGEVAVEGMIEDMAGVGVSIMEDGMLPEKREPLPPESMMAKAVIAINMMM